jgi:hypothetical protein
MVRGTIEYGDHIEEVSSPLVDYQVSKKKSHAATPPRQRFLICTNMDPTRLP